VRERPTPPGRKRRHLEVCLGEDVDFQTRTTGLEDVELPYHALPDGSLTDIDLSTSLLGRTLRAPLLIGAMTGGEQLGARINRSLAEAAQRCGVGFMLGSQRIMLEQPVTRPTFLVRELAPDVLLIGNLGIGQLVAGYGPAHALEAVEVAGADALAIHLNPLQEAVQGGDTDLRGARDRLAALVAAVPFPVVVKEVGHGIGRETARKLRGIALGAIDVAGVGGTSWARVEQFVRHGEVTHPALAELGVPTARALIEVGAELPELPRIASGGVRTGVDAARAMMLGASAVAVARPLLEPAIEGPDAVVRWIEGFVDELRTALFVTGVASAGELTSRWNPASSSARA
jgi:isopentenyl-diphosphate Delta-isomerase